MGMKIRCYNDSPGFIDERLVREQRIMSNLPLYAGVDYHQNQLQLCVMDSTSRVLLNRSCDNDPVKVAKVLGQLANGNANGNGKAKVKSVAIEACCGAAGFAEALAALGADHGDYQVQLAHAGYVAKLKQSPDKSDYSDAKLLADLTRVGYLPRVWLAPPMIRDLRQLTGHRQRLVNQRRSLKLQLGALLREQRVRPQGSRWSRGWMQQIKDGNELSQQLSEQGQWIAQQLLEEIEHVSRQIDKTNARLRQVTSAGPMIQTIKKLRSIEGVGEVTAWMLLAWVGRFDRFGRGKQLARYCGLSPRNASSGQRQADAGLIDAANKPLRAVLIQAAHRLIRTDDRWGKLAQRLENKGKPRTVVVAAVANRWVRSMHHRMLEPLEQSDEE